MFTTIALGTTLKSQTIDNDQMLANMFSAQPSYEMKSTRLSGYLEPGESETYDFTLEAADWTCSVDGMGDGDIDVYVKNGYNTTIVSDTRAYNWAVCEFNASSDGAVCKITIKNSGRYSQGYKGNLKGYK